MSNNVNIVRRFFFNSNLSEITSLDKNLIILLSILLQINVREKKK